MKDHKKKSYLDIVILVFYLSIFIYVVLRAYFLSFTHDESISYSIVAGDPAWINDVNNHILNTFLMGLSSNLFGNNELALRLPNVLSFAIYLLGCFLILKESKNTWLLLLGSSLLLLNPFLIEFFSLARGYGLSLGFMMMSLYFLLKYSFDKSTYKSFIKNFSLSSVFGSLAFFSNLILINYYIACLIIFVFQYLLLTKKFSKLSLKSHLGFIVIMLLASIPLFWGINRLLFLNKLNQLSYGETSLLASIDSIIESSFYFSGYSLWLLNLIKYTAIQSIPIGVLLIIIKKDFSGGFNFFTSLFIILMIGFLFEHYLFSTKYPSARTALIYIPLFGLFMYYFISHIIKHYHPKKIYLHLITLIISIPLLFHFISNINLKYSTWRFDAHTKDAMKIIENYTQNLNDKASISNHWLFEPTINYYISTRKINLTWANRKGIDLTTDFIFELRSSIDSENYKIIANYDDIDARLLKRIN